MCPFNLLLQFAFHNKYLFFFLSNFIFILDSLSKLKLIDEFSWKTETGLKRWEGLMNSMIALLIRERKQKEQSCHLVER
jgi:hypothetical protein